MATKRTKEPDFPFWDDPDADSWDDFLQAVGPNTSAIDIFLMKTDGGREHKDRVGMEVLQDNVFAYLREQFGPGKYLLCFMDTSRKYRGGRVIAVGASGKNLTSGNGAPAVDSTNQFLREQMATQQTLILSLIAAMKPPDLTPMANMMIAAMQNSKQSGPDPTAMLTSVVSAFTALKGPAKDEDWLDRAGKIISLAKDLQPGDAKEENFWSVAKDVGKEVITRLQIGPAPANGVATMIPAGAPMTATVINTAQPAPQPAEPVMGGLTFEQWLKAGIEYLRDKAIRGKGVDWMIDRVLEDAEEPQWAAVIEAIRKGATFENLLQFEPSIGQNPQLTTWFKALYDGLHAEIFKSVDSTGPRGNEGNASQNAGTGTSGEPHSGS